MKNVELNLTSNIFEDLFENKILNKWTILFVNRSLICINIYIYEYFIFHYI